MRNYLFRGKNRYSNRWVYGSLIHAGDFCCILPDDDGSYHEFPYLDGDLGTIDGQAIPVISETVSQFTGVCDKNGAKIFEGDAVQDDRGNTGVVMFANGRYRLFNLYPDYLWRCEENCEVVGNIHDAPGFLEADHYKENI